MEKLKIYAIPIAGVLILLAYWLIVRPMLTNSTVETEASTKK
jgi:hypothetical protein